MQGLVSEKAFQQQITDLAHLLGWRVYHTHDSLRSEPGFPDLILVRGRCCIFAEVKTEAGKLTAEQNGWLDALAQAGAAVYIWKPSAWPLIERVLKGELA